MRSALIFFGSALLISMGLALLLPAFVIIGSTPVAIFAALVSLTLLLQQVITRGSTLARRSGWKPAIICASILLAAPFTWVLTYIVTAPYTTIGVDWIVHYNDIKAQRDKRASPITLGVTGFGAAVGSQGEVAYLYDTRGDLKEEDNCKSNPVEGCTVTRKLLGHYFKRTTLYSP